MAAALIIPVAGRAVSPDPTARSCEAGDAAGFVRCVDRASRGEVDRIVVTGMIACGRDLACGAKLSGVNRPLTILGGSAGAGFSRAADNRAKFELTIEKSSGPITVRGLRFDMGREPAHGAPGELWTTPSCPTQKDCPEQAIRIVGSSDVLVDQVQINDAPRFGIAVTDSSNVTIRRSAFSRSGLHGIWIARTPDSRGLHIENNLFKDNRSNGALLNALPPGKDDPLGTNTVTGNVFDHNHNAAVYHVCGPTGHRPCGGGQLLIAPRSFSFLVADNEFRHGKVDEDPSLSPEPRVAGVEIAPDDTHDITIDHNYFHDQSGGAISIYAPDVAPKVRAIDNVFYHLGPYDVAIGHGDELAESRGNRLVATPGGGWVRPTGRLTLEQCGSSNAHDCGAIIHWSGQNVTSPLRVIVNGREVVAQSGPGGGKRVVSRSDSQPMRYDLYAGATLLDTIELPANQ